MEENYIFCPSCGKKIRNSVVFCPYCNTQFGDSLKNIRPADGTVPPPSPDGEPETGLRQAQSPTSAQPPSQPKNANMKWLAVAGAVLVVALIAGGIWFALGRDNKKTAEVPPTAVPTAEVPESTKSVPVQSVGAGIPADCEPYNLIETFMSNARTDIAPVTDADWVLGPADAEITVIVYSDFQ